ncbi:hypothetical protein Daus18300_009015 [Diaporthe australafricana]|uniref:Ankyrin repeat protein n=1 Tax=Diaporthe australafricana TaxID=127596 RepID=A0ABR3WFP7_9PEZI
MSSPAEGTAAMDHNAQDHLSRLPTEIICLVAKDHGLSIHDLAALAATILWAVRYKRFATIRRFLENGADIDSVQISQACLTEDPKYMYGEGSVPWYDYPNFWFVKDMFRPIHDWHPFTEFTPLAFAAMYGLDSMVAFLLDHGANIEKPGKGICDCADGENDVNMDLPPYTNLTPPGDTYYEPKFLWTPLYIALCRGHESTAMLLLSRGADPQETCPCQAGPWNALQTATLSGAHSIIDQLLDDKRVDIHTKGQWGLTALRLAYYRRDHALVEKYLARGADINASWDAGDGGWTIFAMSCLRGDLSAASDFLRRGADPDFVLKDGEHGDEWTAFGLIYAAMFRSRDNYSCDTSIPCLFEDTRKRRLLEEQILQAKLDKAMRRQREEA